MSVQLLSPEGLMQPVPYHHVAVASGSRQVFVAGQVARDAGGAPSGSNDLAGQVAHALRNANVGLTAAGASFSDVVRMVFYVTAWAPEKIGEFMAGIELVTRELGIPFPLPPASLIGVDFLFEPDVLVEVEVTAVLD